MMGQAVELDLKDLLVGAFETDVRTDAKAQRACRAATGA